MSGDGVCPSCSGDLEQIDDTSLYRCGGCGEEFDEDELEEM
jgi:predicted amidophosphoribosyltransferase